MSNQLPDLRIVSTDHLFLHEDVEPIRVERIVQRIQADQLLKNPVIVAEPEGVRHGTAGRGIHLPHFG